MAANGSESGRIVTDKKKAQNKKKGTGNNVQRRHYTDNLTDDLSERISQEISEPTGQMNANSMPTGSEATDVLAEAAMSGSEATDVLDPAMLAGSEATDVLDPSMRTDAGATDILDPSMLEKEAPVKQHGSTPEQEGTMVLDPAMLTKTNSVFEIERSIILIHTEKVI